MYLQTIGLWGLVKSISPTKITFHMLVLDGVQPGEIIKPIDPKTRIRTSLRLPAPLPSNPAFDISLEIIDGLPLADDGSARER